MKDKKWDLKRAMELNRQSTIIPEAKIVRIILIFYIGYIVFSLLGNIVIKYTGIAAVPLMLFLLYVICLLHGVILGLALPFIKIERPVNIKFKAVVIILFMICCMTTLLAWYLNIKHYGSLVYIFAHSFVIRESSIGQSEGIIPVYVTYINSFLYCLFALLLIGYHYTRRKYCIVLSVLTFILVIFTDLLTFGRIGILYCLFILFAYFILFRKVRINLRVIIGITALFLILNLPRMIRGGFDNFEGSVSAFKNFLYYDIPPIFNSVITVYTYYFSSLFAFSNYYEHQHIEFTYGDITFNPIVNIYNRFIAHNERVSLIADPVYIPFRTNIYSIVKDLYQDFGVIGIILPPIFFGIIIGYIFKSGSITGQALKIYILAWVFYTPIYNPFSFATFLISFFMLILISLLIKLKF
ncbi:O-antigen polymerase [Chitinophaga japonensis]|uniref:Oligosaccharide repeat unit polymerase n=1 Tax=Chitinophaga japonensis TaxID=104662 RepID=A0A562TEU3_CHIJA|nr:O-antigen polymerase [Chitinophaga japonensis]TWI92057.1 oligosaccharide repeat unit polymerase [Chitinophaga japonensis]